MHDATIKADHVGFVLEKVVVRQVLGSAEAILDVATHLQIYDHGKQRNE
jgi:hypothetical protein